MTTSQWILNSQIGPLYFVASEIGLQGIYWKPQKAPILKSLRGTEPSVVILAMAVLQVEEYLAGKRTEFDLPFDIRGTEFQKKVWKELSKIPYGKTCSYRDIAKKIQNEKAVRAVGSANGKNPLSIVVPCHRVIASSGKLAGYAGGVATKTKLLDLEKKPR
jgi:methylated-DNA-[protein]-cysteine S-methyltransferase